MVIKHFTVSANSTKNIDLTVDFNMDAGAKKLAVSSGAAGASPPENTRSVKKKGRVKK